MFTTSAVSVSRSGKVSFTLYHISKVLRLYLDVMSRFCCLCTSLECSISNLKISLAILLSNISSSPYCKWDDIFLTVFILTIVFGFDFVYDFAINKLMVAFLACCIWWSGRARVCTDCMLCIGAPWLLFTISSVGFDNTPVRWGCSCLCRTSRIHCWFVHFQEVECHSAST